MIVLRIVWHGPDCRRTVFHACEPAAVLPVCVQEMGNAGVLQVALFRHVAGAFPIHVRCPLKNRAVVGWTPVSVPERMLLMECCDAEMPCEGRQGRGCEHTGGYGVPAGDGTSCVWDARCEEWQAWCEHGVMDRRAKKPQADRERAGMRENACRRGRGCKRLSGKGKAALFTDLSTGNGDKSGFMPCFPYLRHSVAGTRWNLSFAWFAAAYLDRSATR